MNLKFALTVSQSESRFKQPGPGRHTRSLWRKQRGVSVPYTSGYKSISKKIPLHHLSSRCLAGHWLYRYVPPDGVWVLGFGAWISENEVSLYFMRRF